MKDHEHDYTDTIKQAADIEEIDDTEREKQAELERERLYETFAIASAMNMYGMESGNAAGLLQLELAEELLVNENNSLMPENDNNENPDGNSV